MDIRRSGMFGRFPTLSTKRDQIVCLSDLRTEYDSHIEKICEFIQESADRRINAIRLGESHLLEDAISAEIALASGLRRLDIITFLMERLEFLLQLDTKIKTVEQREYEEMIKRKINP